MGKLVAFFITLWAITVASFYVWFPLFVVLAGAQALAVILVFLIGCYNVYMYDVKGYRNYTILKGFHGIIIRFPTPMFYFSKIRIITKQFLFSDSCRYDSDEIDCVNKLYGISFGNHHKNSARFGWSYNELNGRITAYAYVYKNGIRYIYSLSDEINIGQLYTYELLVSGNKVTFIITRNLDNKILASHDVMFDELPKWGYKLYPYFGGEPTAPHKIKIKEIFYY